MLSSFRVAISLILLWFGTSPNLFGQEPPAAPKPPASPPKVIDLNVSPQAVASLAFRYRLLSQESERTPGDAAPIYLRLWCERSPEGLRQLAEKPPAWLQLSPEQFPLVEARAFVDQWNSLLLQIEYGSKRRTCDWNYTLPEQRDHALEILLPDAQALRQFGRLIALRARVEIFEGKFTEAARTLESGFGLARHVAEGSFLINSLVGNSIALEMLARVDEWVARADAPNLYWSLTALPRPFLNLQKAFELDVMMTEWHFPELAQATGFHSATEWSSLFARFHGRLINLAKLSDKIHQESIPTVDEDLVRFRLSLLPAAQAFFRSSGSSLIGKTDDEVLTLYVVETLKDIRDEWSKGFSLSLPESIPFNLKASLRAREARKTPLGTLWSLPPHVEACQVSEAKLDRKIAALRIVEAIRMQTAADGGTLPESLAKISLVPIPLDPATSQPFNYRLEGSSAILESPPLNEVRLTYKLTLRK